MANCCNPRGCEDFFGARFARRTAARYRKRGLDKTARRMVEFLASHDLDGATVLEVGGGVGAIELELLRLGAGSAVNLELSAAYDAEARKLINDAGLQGRVERRLHDIAADPDAVQPADLVVLHRVVCCYPDYERLLAAAGGRAGRLLVFSYPRRNIALRALIATQNLVFRLKRSEFRAFAHPPAAMLAALHAQGLEPVFSDGTIAWQLTGLRRVRP